MPLRRKKNSITIPTGLPHQGGAMSDANPTHWVPESSDAYGGFIKDAKRAGQKGIPDPSRETRAPGCFWALHQMATDQLHHEAGRFLDEVAQHRLTLAQFRHVVVKAERGDDLNEREERRYTEVMAAGQSITNAYQRHITNVHSIVALHRHTQARMEEVYRQHWPYADHFGALTFPNLGLDRLRYGDEDGGFRMAELLAPTERGRSEVAAILELPTGPEMSA